jgi:hypothetical protein
MLGSPSMTQRRRSTSMTQQLDQQQVRFCETTTRRSRQEITSILIEGRWEKHSLDFACA